VIIDPSPLILWWDETTDIDESTPEQKAHLLLELSCNAVRGQMHERWSQLEGLESDKRWFVFAAKRREQITGVRTDKNVKERLTK